MIDDSINRFKKNHIMPKEIRGWDFLTLNPMTKIVSSKIKERKVVGGEIREIEMGKSCSRFRRLGSGRRRREI